MKTNQRSRSMMMALIVMTSAMAVLPTGIAEGDADSSCDQAVEQTAEDAMISNDSQASAEDSVATIESHCLGVSNDDEKCNQAIGDAATAVVETEDLGAFAEAVEGTLFSPDCQAASPSMIAKNENLIMALNAMDNAGYTLTEVGSSETSSNSIIQQSIVDASRLQNAVKTANLDTCPLGSGKGEVSLVLHVAHTHTTLTKQTALGEFKKTAGVSSADIQGAFGISGEGTGVMKLHIGGVTLPGQGGVSTRCGEVVTVTCFIFCVESITVIACSAQASGKLIGDDAVVDLRITGTARTPGC